MEFKLEKGSLKFISEAIGLFCLHYELISHFPDIKLKPAYESYLLLEDVGKLRVYTARENGELLGYAIFVVATNLRYSDSVQATQDLLFLHPEKQKQGLGSKFIDFIDAQLKAEGVQVVYHHVKTKKELDFSPLLSRRGYEMVDTVWAKRLDKDGA